MSSSTGQTKLVGPVRRRTYGMLAKRALQLETGSAVIDWACEALMAGLDSKSLRILAGLNKPPNEFETDKYLLEALTSLGIEALGKGGLVAAYALAIAEDVAEGRATPRDGCRELSNLYRIAGFPDSLLQFYVLDEQLDLADQGIYGSADGVLRDVVATARRLVEAGPS